MAQGSAAITGYYGDFTVTISVVVKAKSTNTGETVTTEPSTGTDTNTNTDTSGEVPVTPAPSNLFNSSAILSDAGVLQHLNALLESGTGTASFSDVGTHWAQKAIALFSKLNVVDGYGDGSFKPNAAVTRAEFAVLIDRVFNIVSGGTHQAVMNDISSHWAEDTITKLTSAGVLNGYGSSFRPDQNISRAEMVAVISRIVNLNATANSGTNATFSDVGGSFAAGQIAAAAGAGIVSGKGGGKFDPGASSTRAEAVTVLLNTLKLSPEIKAFLDALE
ncbi:Cellulosome-anchoring protein precursor [compost metagenome]